jgi:iron-sulfur cluster assembly accessory protein
MANKFLQQNVARYFGARHFGARHFATFVESLPDSIIITPSCVKKILDLRHTADNPKLKLRIGVDSGGCSGFQYEFKMDDDDLQSDDKVVCMDGSEIVVDMVSWGFIEGSTVDYEQVMMHSAFTITDNPQSESACGCGSSFALKSFGIM